MRAAGRIREVMRPSARRSHRSRQPLNRFRHGVVRAPPVGSEEVLTGQGLPCLLEPLINQRFLLLLILLIICGSSLAGSAQHGQFEVATRAGNTLQVTSRLQPMLINRIHSWQLRLLDADERPIRDAIIIVTGGMPAHDHGLPTQPRVTRQHQPGYYLLEGMRFHMPGQWQIDFTIESDQGKDFATLELSL